MNIVKLRKFYFLLSGLFIIPGIISLAIFGLNFGIDFNGGSRFHLVYPEEKSLDEVRTVFEESNIPVSAIRREEDVIIVRTQPVDQAMHDQVLIALEEDDESVSEKSFETIGATVGDETKLNALKAIGLALIAITLYIAFVFRSVSHPVSSWKFGIVTVLTLAHDIIITIGVFSILGVLLGVEVDALFITALLTVLGFSVHDTIVVFDRIRESLKKNPNTPFDQLVNNSIIETINRSFNTSITVVFVLFALMLFSEGSLLWFVVALLIGIISGVYSSIFTAAPLLVEWYNFDQKRNVKNQKK